MSNQGEFEMFVNSGECRFCETGLPTGFFDMTGEKLFTGDIVIVFTKDYLPDGLTVMVRDDFENVAGRPPEKLENVDRAFAMGIKSCVPSLDGKETIFTSRESDSVWHVRKVKDFSDVVAGEHWKDYGFSYSTD